MVIEAFQLNERGLVAENWFWDAVSANEIITYNFGKNYADPAWFEIKTLEGVMFASAGDYIIQGVQGKIYLCKPDIFLATYEKVEDGKDTGYFSHDGTWIKDIPDVERGGVDGRL